MHGCVIFIYLLVDFIVHLYKDPDFIKSEVHKIWQAFFKKKNIEIFYTALPIIF